MKAEKDDTLSTEVPSFTNSSPTVDDNDEPRNEKNIRLKERIRARQSRKQLDICCSNYNCTLIKKYRNKAKFQKLEYPETGIFKEYCGDCSDAINRKWTCPFCSGIYTSQAHSKGVDSHQWIKCDFGRCGRWIHIECELSQGIKEIKALNDSSFKYYCPGCRENGKKMNICKKEKTYTYKYSKISKEAPRPYKRGTKRTRRYTSNVSANTRTPFDPHLPVNYLFSENY